MCIYLLLGLVIIVVLVSMPVTAAVMLRALESEQPVIPGERSAPAGAIVVLGGDVDTHAPEYGGKSVGALTLQRLRYAAFLHRQTGIPLLVTGGAQKPGQPTLAELMKKVLATELSTGVRWMEHAASSTFENASLSASI